LIIAKSRRVELGEILKKPETKMFSITEIFCKNWDVGSGLADIWASNYVGDELAFSVSRHPNDFLVDFNLEIKFYSNDLMPYEADDIVERQLKNEVEITLTNWWKEITTLRKQMASPKWKMLPGYVVSETYYGLLAYLYETRKPFSYRYITECLASDMNCSLGAAKERIRKARVKGFLTSPGKGLVGQGEITTKAIKLLEKEGLIK
jgi:hypothetical protein